MTRRWCCRSSPAPIRSIRRPPTIRSPITAGPLTRRRCAACASACRRASSPTMRTPRSAAAYRAALDTMKGLGAALVDVDVPHAPYATSAGWVVAMAEAAAVSREAAARVARALRPGGPRAARRRAVLSGHRLHQGAAHPDAADGGDGGGVHPCDVMAVPAGSAVAAARSSRRRSPRTDVKPGVAAERFRGGNTFLGNMTGLPALVLPCGFSAGPPRPADRPAALRPGLRRSHAASVSATPTSRPPTGTSGGRHSASGGGLSHPAWTHAGGPSPETARPGRPSYTLKAAPAPESFPGSFARSGSCP